MSRKEKHSPERNQLTVPPYSMAWYSCRKSASSIASLTTLLEAGGYDTVVIPVPDATSSREKKKFCWWARRTPLMIFRRGISEPRLLI